jgi:cell pole-organizing protein PopZ
MNAAAAPAAIQKAASERQHEPSMEEILASIRRIISEDQPLSLRPLSMASAPQLVAPPPAPVRDAETAVDRLRRAIEPPLDQKLGERAPRPMSPFAERMAQAPIEAPAPDAEIAPAPETSPASVATRESSIAPPPRPEAEPAAPSARPPFPSLQRAFPEAAPMLERVASEEPIAAPPPPAPPFVPEPEAREIASSVLADPPPPHGLLSPKADASIASSFQTLATTMLMQENGLVEEMAREMLRPMLKQWLDDNLPVMVEKLVRAEIERVARGPRAQNSF